MADYSGTINTPTTINDGDTIGSTSYLNIEGAAITVAAGATVEVYPGIYVRLWNTEGGSLTIVGTEENPIEFRPQEADPAENSWVGIYDYIGALTMEYVIIRNTSDMHRYFYTGSSVNKVRYYNCIRPFYGFNTAADGTTITNCYCEFSGNSPSVNMSYDGSATMTFERFWLNNANVTIDKTPGGINLNQFVLLDGDIYVQDQSVVTATQCYSRGFCYNRATEDSTVLTLTDSVLYDCFGTAGIRALSGTNEVYSSYNDYIIAKNDALYYTSGTLESDYDHIAGCDNRPVYIVNTAGQNNGTPTSWTNKQETPVHPLEVDNISEGTPDAESITITYDCAAGDTSKRLLGLPFIKYGTTSGTYDMQTFFPGEEDRMLYWINWKTDMEYKQTGHSVTLSNLKSGTKYYYKCCFVDPLGRVAESAEGNFTTTSVPTPQTMTIVP